MSIPSNLFLRRLAWLLRGPVPEDRELGNVVGEEGELSRMMTPHEGYWPPFPEERPARPGGGR